MSSHPYEYRVMVEYVNPEEAGRSPHFTRIEDQEGFTRTINDVFGHLSEAIPDGWEVVSHDIAVSRSTLILTVLLRRPVQSGEAFNYS